ncbi:amidohydrolase [Clostridiaceae bacterium 35-E11]
MNLAITNGHIVTMDTSKPRTEALVVKNGKFVYVGDREGIKRYIDNTTEIIDLEGKLLLPGFIDSHMHLYPYGNTLQMVNLRDVKSIDELIDRITEFIKMKGITSNQWLKGYGWNQDNFKEKRFPNRYDLDRVSKSIPICITRGCSHIVVVNSKALELAGIHRTTKQIEGGHFDVDNNGEPLGIFRENARKLIVEKIPEPTVEEIKKIILDGAKNAIKNGITSVQTNDIKVGPGQNYMNILKAYEELREDKLLPIRVYEQCMILDFDSIEKFYHLGYKTGSGDEFFKIGPYKFMTDGSLGARTAYLSKPYSDDPTTKGISVYNQEELDKMVKKAHDLGMQIAIHCIGDGAMYMCFDSFEKAYKDNPRKDTRHGLIHCQITDKKLLNKFKELSMIAYIQPIFLNYDLHIVEDRIGKDRVGATYNWRRMYDEGIHLVNGSDCPVETLNVIEGIYSAVTRKDLNGYPENGWLPEQKLTVDEAVYGYTLGAAYTSFEEHMKGSIEVGKQADMVVLSENIYEIHPDKIKDVKVDMTFVGGKLV